MLCSTKQLCSQLALLRFVLCFPAPPINFRPLLRYPPLQQVAGPLLKFSAGIEAGHLALVALALPLLLLMKRKAPRVDRVFSPSMSTVISLIGAFWLVTRLWEEMHGVG